MKRFDGCVDSDNIKQEAHGQTKAIELINSVQLEHRMFEPA